MTNKNNKNYHKYILIFYLMIKFNGIWKKKIFKPK